MATLYGNGPKDGSGSWRASGIIRRDFRHIKDEPEIPRHAGKKSKPKRWCKGQVGAEHTPADVVRNRYTFRGVTTLYYSTQCTRCKKVLKKYAFSRRVYEYTPERPKPFNIYDYKPTVTYRTHGRSKNTYRS